VESCAPEPGTSPNLPVLTQESANTNVLRHYPAPVPEFPWLAAPIVPSTATRETWKGQKTQSPVFRQAHNTSNSGVRKTANSTETTPGAETT